MAYVDTSGIGEYTYCGDPIRGFTLRIRDDAPKWAKEEYERQKKQWEYSHSEEGRKALLDSCI